MEIDKINTFLEAAKCLNFSTAAERLYITPSSISKSISSLEHDLGFQLFYRNNRVLSLTPAGEYMQKYFEKMTKDLEINVQRALALSLGKSSFLRIGTHGFMQILPDVGRMFHAFMDSNPSYDYELFSLQYSELKKSLLLPSGGPQAIDFSLSKKHKIMGTKDCRYLTISKSRILLLARADHPVFQKTFHPTLSDLRNCSFVTIHEIFSPQYTELFTKACQKKAGFTPQITELAKPFYSVIFRAMTTDDIALANDTDSFPGGSLRKIELDWEDAVLENVIVWNSKEISAEARYACEFFANYLGVTPMNASE